MIFKAPLRVTVRRSREGFRPSAWVAAVLAASVLVACGSDAEAPTAAQLDGKSFVSTSVDGHELVQSTEISLTFSDGTLTANAGCNTMTGAYELDGDQLRWTGTPAATMMACDDALAAQDEWITGLLTEGVAAEIDGDSLTLDDGDVTIVLTV